MDIYAAAKPAHFDGLRKTQEVLAERMGVETQLVSKSELRSEIGSDYYHGAVIDPRGAGLHVGKFTRGLGEAAARVGAEIHEKAPVGAGCVQGDPLGSSTISPW